MINDDKPWAEYIDQLHCEDCIHCCGTGGYCLKMMGFVFMDDEICRMFKDVLRGNNCLKTQSIRQLIIN